MGHENGTLVIPGGRFLFLRLTEAILPAVTEQLGEVRRVYHRGIGGWPCVRGACLCRRDA